jgi:hypothetical protein
MLSWNRFRLNLVSGLPIRNTPGSSLKSLRIVCSLYPHIAEISATL